MKQHLFWVHLQKLSAFAEDVLGVAPDAVFVTDAFTDHLVDQQAELDTAGWAIIGGQAYDDEGCH